MICETRWLEKSALDRIVYGGAVTAPCPTLREMIESDQRVVVFAENNAEGVPRYHLAFECRIRKRIS